MNFASIRWRLPASYAAVALLAALSLGALMLLVLNGYYTGQERDYLLGNANVARSAVEQVLQSNYPAPALEDQVKGLGFLSQTQIRVLDAEGRLLADSGIPDVSQVVSLSGAPQRQGMVVFSVEGTAMGGGSAGPGAPALTLMTNETATLGGPVISRQVIMGGNVTYDNGLGGNAPAGNAAAGNAAAGNVADGRVATTLAVSASPFGYGFTVGQPVEARRSAQVVRVPLVSRAGSLEISHGPAYGTDILRSVALAWLAASLAAVTLAGLVGMVASQQVTEPVLALTEAARRMQYGDLSSRAALAGGSPAQEFSALAQTFNQMAQRVEDTVSTLRAFVSDAAHELNTPLTALRTNLELALREPEGGQREIFLSRAVEQNARLERLAGGLLDLSRIEAAQTAQAAPEVELLDLAGLAVEIGERFASRAEQAERSFTLALPAAPVRVPGNAWQLQRLLDNLLENALKFTPPGGTIRLSLEAEDGRAVLRVADTGMGIPSEDLPHLFERFHRGRNAAPYPGTGLGLAIVKAIVGLHGGQVEAQSAGVGQGSEFTIRFR